LDRLISAIDEIKKPQFQSLGRDSVGLDPITINLNHHPKPVSIPRSGFCWFGLGIQDAVLPILDCFNPSVGILLVWTTPTKTPTATPELFQSLGRDSVGLDEYARLGDRHNRCGFNPSVGILLVWTPGVRFIQSGLMSFNPSVGILLVWTNDCHVQKPHPGRSFNPSVGILLVWTGHVVQQRHVIWKQFQSLGRDSVGLDFFLLGLLVQLNGFQSLGRDSVGLDHRRGNIPTVQECVSIPRSGFCWFGRLAAFYFLFSGGCFNPSVGILLVWTKIMRVIGAI